jgi:hypothetical protein
MILRFGKFRGRPIDDVPTAYLEWLLDTVEWLEPWQHHAIEAELADRRGETRRDSDFSRSVATLPFAVSLGRARDVVQAGWRQLARAAHPDVGGSTATMEEINATSDWLEKLLAELETAGARR